MGFAEEVELRKDEVFGIRVTLWEPAGVRAQGMSMGCPDHQGMLGAQRGNQGWDRIRGFIVKVGEMTLGWGRALQLGKSEDSGARCLCSCPGSAVTHDFIVSVPQCKGIWLNTFKQTCESLLSA